MTMHELIKENFDDITNQVLAIIPEAIQGYPTNVLFLLDGEGVVEWHSHEEAIMIDDRYFYIIKKEDIPEFVDYGHSSLYELGQDEELIKDIYTEEIKEALQEYLDNTYFS